MEWKQSTVTDAWLECENDLWVRWSQVIAVKVQPKDRSVYYQIVFVLKDHQYVYATKEGREQARAAVVELLQQLSNEWRQSA